MSKQQTVEAEKEDKEKEKAEKQRLKDEEQLRKKSNVKAKLQPRKVLPSVLGTTLPRLCSSVLEFHSHHQ